MGIEQSRRDDLESMIYSLIYLYKGSLPWQNIQAKSKHEKYAKILEKKINVGVEELCQGMPEEFVTLVQYIRNLQFEEVPDYEMIKNKIKNVLAREKMTNDWDFDWILNDNNILNNSNIEINQKIYENNNAENLNKQNSNNPNIEEINNNKLIEKEEELKEKKENDQNMINNITTNLSTS